VVERKIGVPEHIHELHTDSIRTILADERIAYGLGRRAMSAPGIRHQEQDPLDQPDTPLN
jgi:hypothetical protein